MARPLLTDEMWARIEPLLGHAQPSPPARLGRPRLSDRAALTGILFVLKSGLAWEELPQEMGCGCGMTCLRRLREWQDAGIWDEMRELLVEHFPGSRDWDWTRADNRKSPVRNSHSPGHAVAGPRRDRWPVVIQEAPSAG